MTDVRKTLGLPTNGPVAFRRLRVSAPQTEPRRGQEKRREGHDELLRRLSGRNTRIMLVLTNGEVVEGVLQESDRFSISVRTGLPGFEDKYPTIVFKHAIARFSLDTTRNA